MPQSSVETEWVRNEAHRTLDLEQAQDLLTPLGFTPQKLTLIAEGKVNTNFRVETADSPLFLRLHHGADHVVDIEAGLAERLRDVVPVPRLLGRGDRFLVYEWLPGLSLEQALVKGENLPYNKIARDLAAARVALDGVRFPHFGFLNADLSAKHDWNTAVGAFFGYLRMKLDPPTIDHAFAARMEEVVDHAEPRLREIEGLPVLVHGDFKPTNILVDENGLVGLVDWEFAHAGTRLSDVAQIVRHPDALPEGFARTFGEDLGLDDDAILLARTLDLANLVDLRSKYIHRNEVAQRDIERLAYRVCDEYEARFGLQPK